MTDHRPECHEIAICVCYEIDACEQRTLNAAEEAVAKIWENHPGSDWDDFMRQIQNCFDSLRGMRDDQ